MHPHHLFSLIKCCSCDNSLLLEVLQAVACLHTYNIQELIMGTQFYSTFAKPHALIIAVTTLWACELSHTAKSHQKYQKKDYCQDENGFTHVWIKTDLYWSAFLLKKGPFNQRYMLPNSQSEIFSHVQNMTHPWSPQQAYLATVLQYCIIRSE